MNMGKYLKNFLDALFRLVVVCEHLS